MFVPNHHLLVHLLVRQAERSNGRFGSIWTGETLNRVLTCVLRLTHQGHFESVALSKIARALKPKHQETLRKTFKHKSALRKLIRSSSKQIFDHADIT